MPWVSIGALFCALAVIAGAFGAHGLKGWLTPEALALWETAARYLIYGGFGLMAVGLAELHTPRRSFEIVGWGLLVGSLIFSGTVAALALGGPRWLGAITPLGGLAMILGFFRLAIAARGLGPGS